VSLCRVLEGRSLFGALYGFYSITLSELKSVLQQSAARKVSPSVAKTAAPTATTTAKTISTAAAAAAVSLLRWKRKNSKSSKGGRE
jgi:L-lactate permease